MNRDVEESLKALDVAYRVYCEIADQPGSVVGLQEAIQAYNMFWRKGLSARLRAHYQECDTCNRDLLMAADDLEIAIQALKEISEFHYELNSLPESENMREIAADALSIIRADARSASR